MNLNLTDKTALISGSSKGIGFAIATGLAREGARVIANGRSEKAVAEAKEQIKQQVSNATIERFAGDLSTAAATEFETEFFKSVRPSLLLRRFATHRRGGQSGDLRVQPLSIRPESMGEYNTWFCFPRRRRRPHRASRSGAFLCQADGRNHL